ncbi:MAG: Flp family type IVb pilin [Smithella sp.]|jgi:pilus assembly protein Flp/PilA
MKAIKRFLKGEEGVTAIEYALIAAGIAIAIVIVVFAVGQKISSAFQCVADCLPGGS